MAETKLKIIPLGGLNEIGKNMTVYECGKDIIVVDCGLGFPDDDMLGIDLVIPDITYLVKNQERIRGIVLTHGHEDHIGAVPYVLSQINPPIYATRLTAGLVEMKLAEHNLLDKAVIHSKEAGDSFTLGCFEVEMIHVNHSIADSVALGIRTPLGNVVHTGDFKIDPSPVESSITDLARFGNLGMEGVLALLIDSTNVERRGYSDSESAVGKKFEAHFSGCKKRIIITTFASNVHRIQQILNVAQKFGRKVAITGRSMENVMRLSIEMGYLDVPPNTLIDITKIKNYPPDKIVVVTTGSQGEAMSALYRMAFSVHRQVEIGPEDRVIISASAIPGNERTVAKVVNELFAKGAEVLYSAMEELHVTGHACQDELKIMTALTKPTYFIPVHGEQRHLRTHANVAMELGINPNNIFVGSIGKVLEISKKGARWNGTVPSGRVLVDGSGVGDVGNVVLRDRKHLSLDGMVVVVASLTADERLLVSGPDIITRGFIYAKESEELIEELKAVATQSLVECERNGMRDLSAIKSYVKNEVSSYLFKKTKRNPMILPVIMDV
ncbi:MAG: ribonuclease J [Oscillospiraceae bacterium]|nr:ribonuclease J [Oscillospiraceae bacterium]